MSRELFGTDGIRGLAGKFPLNAEGCRKVGMAVGTKFCKPGQTVVVANDPRESSAQIVDDIIKGLTETGVDVLTAGRMPTPGLAYITRQNANYAAGIMVTASHNPFQYNGIKVFDGYGDKLSDAQEAELNEMIESGVASRQPAGQVSQDDSQLLKYEEFLTESVGDLNLQNLNLAVDSANGAASGLAGRIFARLGAKVTSINDQPDGRNINDKCGATDTLSLKQAIIEKQLDVGIALDGDSDRLIMIDDQGREIKGDHIMYILAVSLGLKGVVATSMSNLGFEQALQNKNIQLLRTDVGDRYVLEGLEKTGWHLGGEQSGHIILPDLLKTGDALLAAVQVLRAVTVAGKTLAEWYDEVSMLPQALINIPLDEKSKLDAPQVKAFLESQQQAFAGQGRLLIRPSGTEPLARVMVEAEDAQGKAQQIAGELERIIKEL